MKKDYMKPQGNVVAMQVNENIALSIDKPTSSLNYGVNYVVIGDKRFIQGDVNYEASNTGDEKYDRFYDLIITYLHNLPSNCRYNP